MGMACHSQLRLAFSFRAELANHYMAHTGSAGMFFTLFFFYFLYSPHSLRHKDATQTLGHMPAASKCCSSHPIYADKMAKVLCSPTLVSPLSQACNVNRACEDTLSSPLGHGDKDTATQLHGKDSSGHECLHCVLALLDQGCPVDDHALFACGCDQYVHQWVSNVLLCASSLFTVHCTQYP